MKPSGVQHASAIVPPGRQTRSNSPAARSWSGANMQPNTDMTASKDASGNGSASASRLQQLDRQPLGGGPPQAALEQRRDVVDADDATAVAGRGDRRVAAASGDVEDAPAGAQVGGVAQVLGDEDDPRRDRVKVAARPDQLLAPLDLVQIRRAGA